jgi:hypothetical protein
VIKMKKISVSKDTVALFFVVLVFTSANIWLHRDSPPSNWEIIEQYGISFSHPSGYRFIINTPTDWIPSYWEGGLQGEPTTGELEIIGIYWLTDRASNVESAIEYVLTLAKTENPRLTNQDVFITTISTKDIKCCYVELDTNGLKVPGLLCAFEDPYGRTILTYHLRYQGSYEYSTKMMQIIIKSINFTPPIKPRN